MFFGVPYDQALCCASCCRDNTLVGAYWGFSICGGRVHISRLPEVYRAGAVFNDDLDAYSWSRTDSVAPPNLTEGSVTYKCVSGAGTQCSDAGVTLGVSYVWAQLNYAPLDDLATTQPRAALARIAVHDSSTSAVSSDTENRSATLEECWLINDENSDPYYWDSADKLCNYKSTTKETCVGPGHFVLEQRRVSGDNEIRYWLPDVADATVVTWANPEENRDSTYYVAKYDPVAFPMALFIRTTVNTSTQVTRTVDCGYANPANGQKDSSDPANKVYGSGNTYNWSGEWIRGDGGAPAFSDSNTAVYCEGFAFHGAYVPLSEADITPFEHGDDLETAEPSRVIYQGTAILRTQADFIDVYAGLNRASTTVYTDDEWPPEFQFLWGSGVTESPVYTVGGHDFATVRLWGFPGNHRCGRQSGFWSYDEVDSETAAGLGAFATFELGGEIKVRSPAGTTTTIDSDADTGLRVRAWPLSEISGVKEIIVPNGNSLRALSLTSLRFLPAAYDHNGDVSSDDSTADAPRNPRFAIENFPLSLFANEEPDAVDVGQYTPAEDPAVSVDEWNRLAHPEYGAEATAGLGTRWCYHWVYTGGYLFPMIRINSQGKWEPREPPVGQWYDTDGELHRSRTLCWDGHIDEKHPSSATWGL